MFCDRIVVLLAGAAVACGAPESVLTEALRREALRRAAEISPSPRHGRPPVPLMGLTVRGPAGGLTPFPRRSGQTPFRQMVGSAPFPWMSGVALSPR